MSRKSGSAVAKPSTSGPVQCNQCLVIISALEYPKHMKIHDPTGWFHCPCCTRRIKQQSNMQTHIRTQHTHEKPFECTYPSCSYSTGDPACFTKHKKLFHNYIPDPRAPRAKGARDKGKSVRKACHRKPRKEQLSSPTISSTCPPPIYGSPPPSPLQSISPLYASSSQSVNPSPCPPVYAIPSSFPSVPFGSPLSAFTSQSIDLGLSLPCPAPVSNLPSSYPLLSPLPCGSPLQFGSPPCETRSQSVNMGASHGSSPQYSSTTGASSLWPVTTPHAASSPVTNSPIYDPSTYSSWDHQTFPSSSSEFDLIEPRSSGLDFSWLDAAATAEYNLDGYFSADPLSSESQCGNQTCYSSPEHWSRQEWDELFRYLEDNRNVRKSD